MPEVISPIYLEERDVQELQLIKGTHPISVAFSQHNLTMFAVTNTDVKEREILTVRIRGTGIDVSDLRPGRFLGTVIEVYGGKTLHVWVDHDRRDADDV